MTDTETKLEWIRGAVTHLDATPASPRVGTLTMGVLDYLISRTQSKPPITSIPMTCYPTVLSAGMIKMGQMSRPCVVSAKMTLNMLIGVRNMSVVAP